MTTDYVDHFLTKQYFYYFFSFIIGTITFVGTLYYRMISRYNMVHRSLQIHDDVVYIVVWVNCEIASSYWSEVICNAH